MSRADRSAKRWMPWLFVAALTACAGEVATDEEVAVTKPMTFEEFRDSLPDHPEMPGVRFVEGDMPMTEAQLQEYFDQHYEPETGLIVKKASNGFRAIWTGTQRMNLTYCVSNDVSALYGAAAKTALVNAIAAAATEWEGVTPLDYRYLSQHDGNCNTSNTSVLFDANVDLLRSDVIAYAFFPDDVRSKRVLRIYPPAFFALTADQQRRVMLHELGHTLGFVHEHLRPEHGDCTGDPNTWIELTRYDSQSIMIYPNAASPGCGPAFIPAGLTTMDRRGTRCAYEVRCEWAQLAGAARDVDVNQAAVVWSVSNTATTGGFKIQKWNHSTLNWEQQPNGAVRIAVASNGLPWWVDNQQRIFRAQNGQAVQVAGSARDIATGFDGSVWAITNQPVNGGYKVAKWNGSTWVIQTGIYGSRITVDVFNAPFVTLPTGEIYHLENGTWVRWPGLAKDIDAGANGALWVIGFDSIPGGSSIWEWNNPARRWERTTGAGNSIAVAQNGQPWITNTSNQVFVNVWEP